MSGIPQMLNYPEIKPRGVSTEFKTMRFTPLTSFNQYVTNDIVRFWIPSAKGFWDPYKSYIELEVEVSDTDFPYGHAVQVDNSASSFISQMTIFVDGQEIQRRQEYDSIAALLHDAMYTPGDQFGKEYEGTGYMTHNSMGINVDTRRVTTSSYADGCIANIPAFSGQTAGTATIKGMPVYTSGYLPMYPRYIDATAGSLGVWQPIATANYGNNIVTTANTTQTSGNYDVYRLPRGLTNVDRVSGTNQYNPDSRSTPPSISLFPYMSDLQSFPLQQFGLQTFPSGIVDGLQFQDANILAPRPFVQGLFQSSCYGVQSTTASNFNLYQTGAWIMNSNGTSTGGATAQNTAYTQLQVPTYGVSTVRKNGYSQAFSQQLSNSSNQPVIAPGSWTSWIHNGAFQSVPVKTNKRVFQIPILSSLMGVLVPLQSYKLIPMQALMNLMIEFRLNEYAMFTSGYLQNFTSSTKQRCYEAMGAQLKRAWKINRFEIYGAIFQFDDFITNMVSQRLNSSGITLASNGWTIGPRFTIATTSQLKNTWQINAGYQSVKTLCFRIQSDDYQKYSFCRKHYYYSGNVTSLQLQIANVYIPPQPIQGHAGNIIPVGNEGSNAPFIIQMHKTFGKLFNVGRTMYINATNFAVNDRPYNVANQASYSTLISPTTSYQQNITNIDTAMGLPLFHQNRCVGRALYAFNLQALPGQVSVISGLNTLQWRPFQVIIDSDSAVTNGRDATLMFFLNYDVIYNLKAGQPPEVYGLG